MRSRSLSRRPVVAAMMLGTALAAFSSTSPVAASPSSPRIVADLDRYCTACWRNARVPADLWGDCTQEVFGRLLERVSVDGWERALRKEGEERREFLRAIDAVKKRVRRTRRLLGDVEGVADRRDPADRRLAEDREAVRQAAAALLSPRQRQVLQHSFEGWSVTEIAAKLRLSPARVSDEKYKAVQKLRSALCEHDHHPASGGR